MHQVLFHTPFFILVNNPQTAIACKKFFLKLDILKEGYQKPLKKLTLFFLSNPVPFNGQSYEKQKGLELVTSHSSDYKTSLQKFLY